MISTRVAGLIAGIALAIGLVVGAAGAIVARDAVNPMPAADSWADHMAGMAGMMGGSGMGPDMMGSGGSGMGPDMMGSGGSGMGPDMMGSDASSMLNWMSQHHGATTPQVTP